MTHDPAWLTRPSTWPQWPIGKASSCSASAHASSRLVTPEVAATPAYSRASARGEGAPEALPPAPDAARRGDRVERLPLACHRSGRLDGRKVALRRASEAV